MPTMPAIPHCIITTKELLKIFNIGLGAHPTESLAGIILRDSDWVSSFGRTLNSIRQERIAIVIQDADFQSWLKSTHSQSLVINGMEMDSHW